MYAEILFDDNFSTIFVFQLTQHNRWPTVIKLLEKLAHICDIGAVRLDADAKIRVFYWTALSEFILEHRGDHAEAMTCISKAVEKDNNAVEWRIIFVRILLSWTKNIIISRVVPDKTKPEAQSALKLAYKPEAVLADTLTVRNR